MTIVAAPRHRGTAAPAPQRKAAAQPGHELGRSRSIYWWDFFCRFFVGFGRAAGFLGFSFLLRGIALRVGLVLLSLAFVDQVVAAGDGFNGLLGFALDVLDDALDAFFRSAVAWFYVVLLSIGYMVSRGLAKSGSRHHHDA